MVRLSIASDDGGLFFDRPFYKNGTALSAAEFPRWGMTVRRAGSMRFRWNEQNPHRDAVLSAAAAKLRPLRPPAAVSLEQVHSKAVRDVRGVSFGAQGDGLVSADASFMPVVTVADCVPIFLFEPESGAFGVVHSGWKGTGIVAAAVERACAEYGASARNFCIAIGAHIRDCCYVVDAERAAFFARSFSQDCVRAVPPGEPLCRGAAAAWKNGGGALFRLSLERANLAVLERIGVRDENIVVLEECTCCNPLFGSNRRETSEGGGFTVQAAFVVR